MGTGPGEVVGPIVFNCDIEGAPLMTGAPLCACLLCRYHTLQSMHEGALQCCIGWAVGGVDGLVCGSGVICAHPLLL